MKRIALFLAIAVTILISACSSCKKQPSISNIPVNDSLKAAFNFMPGTYWIYQDSISGEVDSFVVQSNNTSNIPSTYPNNTYSVISIQISQNFPGSSLTDYKIWNYYYQGNEMDIEYFGSDMVLTYYSHFINFPFQDSLFSPGYSTGVPYYDSALVDNIFSSYTVNSNVFINVAEVNHWMMGIGGTGTLDYNDLFYMCPNIGIIKMKLYHPLDSINRVWKILRWNIVK